MSAILLDRDLIHYEVLGRGRPIVFLHGWIGSWRYWVPAMQAASISYRAYALDLWGFGDSAKNERRYTLDQQIHLLEGFLQELGIGRVALIGHGLGALVALMYAVNHQEIVDRVMAISYPMESENINPRLYSLSPNALAEWLLVKTALSEPARVDAMKTDPQAISTSLKYISGLSFCQLWGESSTACLLVNGQNDPAITTPSLDGESKLPQQTHRILFEESGHFPMLDENSKFNRLMVDFLSLSSGESPRDLQLKEEWKRRVR
jgi:pimeloyl-ACP methyl ester carboxylesterase